MASRKNVQNTHKSENYRELHMALLDIVRAINRPQGDETLIAAAGVRLDRALFPLLVGIERYGPIGVVELAEGVGRDHTTISRQVTKLESLGLAERQQSAADGRVRQAIVTDQGKAMIAEIDAARSHAFSRMFAQWPPGEVGELTRLMRKFGDSWRDLAAESGALRRA